MCDCTSHREGPNHARAPRPRSPRRAAGQDLAPRTPPPAWTVAPGRLRMDSGEGRGGTGREAALDRTAAAVARL